MSDTTDFEYAPVDFVTGAAQATFQGFKRANGQVGTRNYIGILTSVNCSTTVAGFIAREVERSGILADGRNGFFFQTIDAAIRTEGDVFEVIDVLAREVGVIGIFSDWPATTTFYANCVGLR